MNPASSQPVRVLIAEDDLISRMVLARMAETIGCACTQTGNGREALESAQAAEFDLILLDIEMPEMDGIEAASALRDHVAMHPFPSGKRPHVVALTGDLLEPKLRDYRQSGFDACLGKPMKFEQFQVLVDFVKTR